MKLFCFTYAGGNADFYDQIKGCLEPEVTVKALEYAGHGKRRKDPFYASIQEMAEDMYSLLKAELCEDESYAIMGYSMGSIVAVEVLKRILSGNEVNKPEHVFLAAHEPFTKSELRGYSSDEMDEEVKRRTIQFGGIPERLIHNNSFWRMYLPLYKADYSMLGKYSFEELDLNATIPATIFYSESDTAYEDMVEWKRYFIDFCDFRCYSGTHFFIQEHYEEMANDILERLR